MIGEKAIGTQANIQNATLGTKVEVEGKLGPFSGSLSTYAGRQYPENEKSSIYRGIETKASLKPQMGVGLGIKWDIWNGRTKKYDNIK